MKNVCKSEGLCSVTWQIFTGLLEVALQCRLKLSAESCDAAGLQRVGKSAAHDEVMSSICSCLLSRIGRALEATQKIVHTDALLAKAAS